MKGVIINVIQHLKTGKYLAGKNRWVAEIGQATKYLSATQGLKNCSPRERRFVEVLNLRFRRQKRFTAATSHLEQFS